MGSAGSLTEVLTWFTVSLSLLTAAWRLFTKLENSLKLELDDLFVVAAVLSHVGSGVATAMACQNGLGSQVQTLTSSQVTNFEQASYAAQLLTVPTLSFAKMSITLLMRHLFPLRLTRRLCSTFCFILAAWAAASIFAVSFQCGLPEPWNYNTGPCINQTAFWRFTGAFNILTDLVLVATPMYLIKSTTIKTRSKVVVITCFGMRLLDVVCSGMQLAYSGGFQSNDWTASQWRWFLCNQFVQLTTIVTSCIPYLKRHLEAFPDGTLMMTSYVAMSHADRLSRQMKYYRLRRLQSQTREVALSVSKDPLVGSPRREAYETADIGTRSTAEATRSVHRQEVLSQPEQIHVRQTIDVEQHVC